MVFKRITQGDHRLVTSNWIQRNYKGRTGFVVVVREGWLGSGHAAMVIVYGPDGEDWRVEASFRFSINCWDWINQEPLLGSRGSWMGIPFVVGKKMPIVEESGD